METVLMIVTIVALALAIAMAVVAWRLLRENRARSAARAEVLQTLAASDADEQYARLERDLTVFEDDDAPEPQHEQEDEIEVLRPAPQFQRRQSDWDFALAENRAVAVAFPKRTPPPSAAPSFAATTANAGAPATRWFGVVAAALLMGAAAAALYKYGPAIAAESPLASLTSPARTVRRPIELLSLRHNVEPGGTFMVTGLVQNPSDGGTVRKAVAVVYLFDRDGKYFASGKSALEFGVLAAGAESPFVVRVPNVTNVSRYRVAFRTEDDDVVPHVDRRGQAPEGTTEQQ